jgi:hypothetical protein
VKSILVHPDHWRTGAAVVLMDEMMSRLEACRRKALSRGGGFEWVDLSLTSEENPQTPVLAARFGGRVYKRYRTYIRPIP